MTAHPRDSAARPTSDALPQPTDRPARAGRPRAAVLTGAGISTAAGIPDFRGPSGVWTLFPDQARLLDIDAYLTDPGVRRAGWRAWADSPVWTARPSAAHRALVKLESAGLLHHLVTQNFDGLHQQAGSSRRSVAEVHGTVRSTSCLECGRFWPTPQVLVRLEAEPDPRCEHCGGILKADVVYFGEQLPTSAFTRALRAAQTCETFLAIGTTLTVQPVASLAQLAVESGARLVVVNREPTAQDSLATRVISDDIQSSVPELVTELIAASAVR